MARPRLPHSASKLPFRALPAFVIGDADDHVGIDLLPSLALERKPLRVADRDTRQLGALG
jgi:hypothetical protein